MTNLRPTLGDYSSVVCFKAVITGVEDTLGPDGAAVVFTRAGRVRGHSLAKELGVSNSNPATEEITKILDGALGKDGTRLTGVASVTKQGDDYIVDCFDTVCSAGEVQGSDRRCTFTLGAVQGAIEEITGQTFMAEQTESVLRGGQYDRFVFSPL
ncbi:hypothetical protein [Deinococcus sp.]|uniref:hypothetical protein n=1 Tax=Deinococcus sp. TaxID=47478 RepID=UPI0025C0C957|nr:hypothetical protein [Deinococcus sp.]